VLFVSLHHWPLYPGTGRLSEQGTGAGCGTTMNFPLPPGATGDVYLQAFDDVIAPVVEKFDPTWLLISAGFDAHRADPLAELALTAGDYALLTARARQFVPPGRCVAMLEGGYDLDALSASTSAVLSTLAGTPAAAERPSSGGPGAHVVAEARKLWQPQLG
jgi:acetoin utilization deacetylase AcuC-like enzyme